jgi:hypothetical protein
LRGLFAQALMELRRLSPERLPRIASDALAAGLDTPALRALAGHTGNTAEAWELFGTALEELDRPPIGVDEAALISARFLANELLDGRIEARGASGRSRSSSASWCTTRLGKR